MKLKIVLLFVIIAFLAISCEKTDPVVCTTCIEQQTMVSSEYCGMLPDVQSFENQLNQQGGYYGQTWRCTRH